MNWRFDIDGRIGRVTFIIPPSAFIIPLSVHTRH